MDKKSLVIQKILTQSNATRHVLADKFTDYFDVEVVYDEIKDYFYFADYRIDFLTLAYSYNRGITSNELFEYLDYEEKNQHRTIQYWYGMIKRTENEQRN